MRPAFSLIMSRTNHADVGSTAAASVASRPLMHAVVSVYQSRELLWNLTLRELRTKYRRSFLGWAWSMLNPLAMVAIYGFVFGTLFDAHGPGRRSERPRPLRATTCSAACCRGTSSPSSTTSGSGRSPPMPVSSAAWRSRARCWSSPTCCTPACSSRSRWRCFGIILLIAGSPFLPWLPVVVLTSVLLAVFGSGFALALSVLSVYFRDMSYLWAIVLQVWFFATPIVYPPELLEAQAPDWVQNVLKFNPINGFVEVYRRCLYDAAAPGWRTMLALGRGVLRLARSSAGRSSAASPGGSPKRSEYAHRPMTDTRLSRLPTRLRAPLMTRPSTRDWPARAQRSSFPTTTNPDISWRRCRARSRSRRASSSSWTTRRLQPHRAALLEATRLVSGRRCHRSPTRLQWRPLGSPEHRDRLGSPSSSERRVRAST